MNIKFFSLVCFLTTSVWLSAQNIAFDQKNFKDLDALNEAIKNLEEGDRFYKQGAMYYKNAMPYYEKAYAFNPNNAQLNFKLGKCFLRSASKSNALKYFERSLELNPAIDPKVHYFLGMSYHLSMEWDKAIASYTKYLEVLSKGSDTKAMLDVQNRINQCTNGKEFIAKPLSANVENLGKNLNTEYNEYGAVVSADESVLMFTSRRPSSTGGAVDALLNENFEDIYVAYKQEDGQWSTAVNMPTTVNGRSHDAVSAVSADGQKMIIYLGSKKAGDLYESILSGNAWGKAKSMGKNINSKYHEPSGCYSPDGNMLYFVSDRPGGKGQHDIYVSQKDKNGQWGPAKNLGSVVNTAFDEVGVFVHPDGKTMYFSSDGHKSIGGFDIFKTVYDQEKDTWSTPENIGYPVNTVDDDMFFVVSASGRRAYYTSFGAQGFGRKDLYMITFIDPIKSTTQSNDSLPQTLKEVPLAQVIILKGVVKDAGQKKPLEATVEIIDIEQNKVISSFKSNSATGKYLVSLPAGKNYGIVVKKDGYLFHSENFNMADNATFEEIQRDIELKAIAVGNNIVLKNIFFDFDKATLRPESTNELQRLTKLLKETPALKIEISGHTDSKGSNEYNKALSNNRAKAVVDYLINSGIPASRLVYKGYGEEFPISSNETEEGRQKNRRTEFKVLGM